MFKSKGYYFVFAAGIGGNNLGGRNYFVKDYWNRGK